MPSKRDAPKFIDLFAGCGGLSYGLMKAGWQGLFAIEHDQNAFASLSKNLILGAAGYSFKWPEWLATDAHSITDIVKTHRQDLERLKGQVDLIVGGPPCQGFSSAGRRLANDPRNQLTSTYLEFVRIIEPKFVLIENVKGIAIDFDDENSETGRINYAKKIIDELSDRYAVFHKVLDTSLFGVPQKRKRFFIIGIHKDHPLGKNQDPFSKIEIRRKSFLEKHKLNIPISASSAISDLEKSRNGTRDSEESRGFSEISYKGPLTEYQKLLNGAIGVGVSDLRLARHQKRISDRFTMLIKTCGEQNRLNVSLSTQLRASLGLKKCAIRVLDPNGPSPTITSMPDDLIHYSEPRTLTVRENARLQSFPDCFVFLGKYTSGGDRRRKEVPRFTQVANAVPPLVAEVIGLALKNFGPLSTTSKIDNASVRKSQIVRRGIA